MGFVIVAWWRDLWYNLIAMINKIFFLQFRFRKAYTLIDVIMVMTIIGIIAALAIPRFAPFYADFRTFEKMVKKGGESRVNIRNMFSKGCPDIKIRVCLSEERKIKVVQQVFR